MDAVASVLIGVILVVTAALLAYEAKGLLTGEAASPATVAEIKLLVTEQPGIRQINELLTMHFGPEDVLLNLSLDFADSAEVESMVSTLERSIKDRFPEITRVFIEAQRSPAVEAR